MCFRYTNYKLISLRISHLFPSPSLRFNLWLSSHCPCQDCPRSCEKSGEACRVRSGHVKPGTGKSWNLWFQSRGKEICFRKIKRQKDKKFEKIKDVSKTGFNFRTNDNKHVFYALRCWKMLLNDCFDTTVRTKCFNFDHGKGRSWNFKIVKEYETGLVLLKVGFH